MATLSSRFQRRAADDRVGDILSDSNSDVSSLDGEGRADARGTTKAVAARTTQQPEVVSASEEDDDEEEEDENATGSGHDAEAAVAKVHQRPLHTMKRKNSKWYDSDNDDDDWDHVASDSGKVQGTERARARGTAARSDQQQAKTEVLSPEPNQSKVAVTAPEPVAPTATAGPKQAELGGKRSSFQRLVGKTFNLSPFGSKRKGLDVASPASSGPDTPRGGGGKGKDAKPNDATPSRMRSPLSDTSSIGDGAAAVANASERRGAVGAMRDRKRSHDRNGMLSDQTSSDVVSPQGYRDSPAAADTSSASSRRRSNMVQSPGADDAPSTSAAAMRRGSELPANMTPAGETALSPGQRKVPGAFPGRPGSGVLLEGWLRQKQRRGVKGMKKWNSRYFVLYAKTNEVRYYADVVQSAWGPIPLGEIGCISLRLIQRIGKPGMVKYKGCRLDITCRNTWGTHYADDYVSSEDENSTSNNNNNNNNNNTRSSDKNTPRSSRVYSLMADSPQTAGAWFSMLDSLLVRSANSPRVDVAPSSSSSSNKQLKRVGSMGATATATAAGSTKMMTRRRSSALDTEAVVLSGPDDHVPKPVLYAINFIFDSSPGIETERFYEAEPDAAKLKSALRFLNQFATETQRKPTKEELEQALDAATAGAVLKLWLAQLEQPIVPFEMYDDFRALAADAKDAPFELSRHLGALVRALPPRNLAMLACLLFHLNDVNVYASKNGMNAALLASMFADYIVRPRGATAVGTTTSNDENERQSLRVIVEEMIAHVDRIIDEKEADILDRV